MTTTIISIGQRSPPWRTGRQRSWRRSALVPIWNAGASRPLVSSNWIGGIPVIRDFIWHLGPEQAVEAHRLVRGKRMIPVHWGLLKLAHHSWTEPVERVLAAAKCRNVDVLVPRPGESIEPTLSSSRARWWPEIPWRSAHQTPIVATRDGVASQRFGAARCDP